MFAYISRVSPGIIYENKKSRQAPLYILIAVIAILAPVGLLAPGTAWGEWGLDEIKKVAGYLPAGMKNGFNFNPVMQDYNAVIFKNNITGYLVSAIAGSALLIIISKLLIFYFKKKAWHKKEDIKKK